MKTKLLCVLLIPLVMESMTSCKNSNFAGIKTISFETNWDTIRPLANPDKGWYHHMFDNGIIRYLIQNDSTFFAFPGMDHLYLRLAWAFLEPEEGKFNWEVIDTLINKYVPLGYKFAFCITSMETGGAPYVVPVEINGVPYATPYWVRQAGAKGVTGTKGGSPFWAPDWSDPVYLEKLENFQRAFAERYDGKPWVRRIEIGSIGEWGEGHTFRSTGIPPTVEDVKANMDVYLRCFKKTQLLVPDDLLHYQKNDEDIETLYNYAVDNGCTLGDWSPLVGYYIKNYLDTWTVSHPHFYDPLYLTKPIVFELEHYRIVKRNGHFLGKNGRDTIPGLGVSGAHIFRKAIELIHPTYISFHGWIDTFLIDNPDLPAELLNLCGYWYFPVSAEFAPKMKSGNNSFKIDFINKGVAPAYRNYSLILRLEPNGKGKPVELVIEDAQNKLLLPGIQKTLTYSFTIPDEIKTGNYMLKFKLKDLNEWEPREVFLGINESLEDDNHFINLGKVKIEL